jgi:Na+/H+ antiporter NhaD/arsenite permease-like protein
VSLSKHKLIVVALALSLAAVDLTEKAFDSTHPVDYHARSAIWAVTSGLLLVAAVALAHLRSRAVAVSAGVMAGGVLANLVSAIAGNGRVPNPIVIGTGDGVAFNLADVFTLIGLFALIGSVCVVLILHRERLLPPRAWERALWRKLRGS